MPNEKDIELMKKAIEISKNCPVSYGAYSVGAIIVDPNGAIISTGYSRETADNVHAEEVAINKAIELGIDLSNTTIYSTMEPCGLRLSGKKCCADRIIEANISKVIYAINEPPFLVQNCTGAQKLIEKGIHVEQIKELNDEIHKINSHIK